MLLLLSAGVLLSGCTRGLYRRQADRESHYLVREKSVGTPWEIPSSYTIQPDPRSRFFDPSQLDYPVLPPAGPQLYQYRLPELTNRDGGRLETLPPPLSREPENAGELPVPADITRARRERPGDPLIAAASSGVQLASYQQEPTVPPVPTAEDATPDAEDLTDPFADDSSSVTDSRSNIKGLNDQRIDRRSWEDIPQHVLTRMLEFPSVQDEYRKSFQQELPPELLSKAPRMSCEDLFELALLNSRAYQLEKELLYESALTLSLERFAYATKFTVRGTTVDTTYTHRRVDGVTVNTLAVPSAFSGDKLLASSGTFVGQFANNVMLTFNGPAGFAADISSEMLFQFTQRVFQRDILLEPLIQSERDLVYAARRFARFRKEFFLDIATTYYNILLTYRQVEIDAQNYFSQVLNFQQAREEVASGITMAPNVIFFNQYEQGVLTARSSLIRQCLRLEDELDSMKLVLGLPTETPLDVDLTELEQLTLRDLIEVNREQVRRWQTRLENLRSKDLAANHADILTANYSLAERLIIWFAQRHKVDPSVTEPVDLQRLRTQFRLDAARLDSLAERGNLQEVQTSTPPKQRILVLQRQVDLIDSVLELVQRQGQFAVRSNVAADQVDKARGEHRRLHRDFVKLQDDLNTALESNPDDAVIIGLIDQATNVLAALDTTSQNLDDALFGGPVQQVDLQQTLARSDTLMEFTQEAFNAAGHGLPPLDISVDAAMVTALVQRLDLMNERGALADRWREIKIAADELRSRLDLNASQTIGTAKNRPFGFSTDNSNTRLQVAWDLPLNRKRDRNLYRRTLINYNVELRSLQEYEDTIKLEVRRQLRNLEQASVQYPISVAQAALAEEQVLSTRLQLILGLPGVRAPDLLLAYNDSRQALSDMVDRRIGYIVERARFALDLEVMMLDDAGFWPEVNDPRYQPQPNSVYPWNAGSAYGDFPSFLKVSHDFRCMLNYPPPGAAPGSTQPAGQQPAPAGTTASEPETVDPQELPAVPAVSPPSS
ncbi:MAG: TolC family protein [Pirellulaceae bacterium]